MLDIRNVKVNFDRSVEPYSFDIGMQHENGIVRLDFEFDEKFSLTNEYLYFMVTDDGRTLVYPIIDNSVVIGSEITQKKRYVANIVVSKNEIIDELNKNYIVWISKDVILTITANSIITGALSPEVLPVQLQIVYDDLFDLKADLINKLESGYFKGEKGDKGDKGDTGEQGAKGDKGDTEVTKENIKTALGQNPLIQPSTAQIGQTFKVQSINEDGTLGLEAVDMQNIDDIEGQISELKGDLDEYLLDSKETIIPGKAEYNMLNPENSIVGTVNMQGVAIENPSSAYLASDFIEVRKSETYAFSYYNTTYNVRYALYPNRIALYNNNKTFVGQTTDITSENDYFTANRINVSGNTCYLAVTPKTDGYIRIQYSGNQEQPQIAIAPYYEYLENFLPIPDYVVVAKSVKKKIITREQLSDDINAELDKIPCYPTLLNVKHHNSVCCIGDSLTEGYHTAGDIRQNKSYPKFIGQLCSWETENKGMSGITSLGWWNTFKDSVDFTKFDAFMIYLGTNGGLTDTIDSDTISGDYNTFAQTNTGGYCAICAKIRDVNPKAKIYIVKYGDSKVSNITQKIADKYGATVLLFTDKTYYDLTDSKYHTDLTHLNTHGYFCFAHAMALQMEKYISEHLDEYTDLQ